MLVQQDITVLQVHPFREAVQLVLILLPLDKTKKLIVIQLLLDIILLRGHPRILACASLGTIVQKCQRDQLRFPVRRGIIVRSTVQHHLTTVLSVWLVVTVPKAQRNL